jgi:hypothetical protein
MENNLKKFDELLNYKKINFQSLIMNRIIENDNKYLITLDINKLIKLKEHIHYDYTAIYKIDEKIIKICKDYNSDNKVFFYTFLSINNVLNNYLLLLMSEIPLLKKDIYKLYIIDFSKEYNKLETSVPSVPSTPLTQCFLTHQKKSLPPEKLIVSGKKLQEISLLPTEEAVKKEEAAEETRIAVALNKLKAARTVLEEVEKTFRVADVKATTALKDTEDTKAALNAAVNAVIEATKANAGVEAALKLVTTATAQATKAEVIAEKAKNERVEAEKRVKEAVIEINTAIEASIEINTAIEAAGAAGAAKRKVEETAIEAIEAAGAAKRKVEETETEKAVKAAIVAVEAAKRKVEETEKAVLALGNEVDDTVREAAVANAEKAKAELKEAKKIEEEANDRNNIALIEKIIGGAAKPVKPVKAVKAKPVKPVKVKPVKAVKAKPVKPVKVKPVKPVKPVKAKPVKAKPVKSVKAQAILPLKLLK